MKDFIRARASANRQKVIATVNSSYAESKTLGNGLTRYSPVIEYQYLIGGKVYTNSKFTFMGTIGARKSYAEKCSVAVHLGVEFV